MPPRPGNRRGPLLISSGVARRLIRGLLGTLVLALGGVVAAAAAAPPTDPAAVVDHVDRLHRGESADARVTMVIVTRHWKRTLAMHVLSEGTDRALIRITAPAREAGTTTLKSGPDIWNYLPRIDRTIRLPTSMMKASWMGSHFTNDDLVKESRLVRDYDIAVSFEGTRGGAAVREYVLTPRPTAPVVWGKIVMEVRQKDTMPTWIRYHGDDGGLRRTLAFSDYHVMSGRLVPAVVTAIPADEPDESSVVRYTSLRFGVSFAPDAFSLAALRR